jgi:hypothetical protein
LEESARALIAQAESLDEHANVLHERAEVERDDELDAHADHLERRAELINDAAHWLDSEDDAGPELARALAALADDDVVEVGADDAGAVDALRSAIGALQDTEVAHAASEMFRSLANAKSAPAAATDSTEELDRVLAESAATAVADDDDPDDDRANDD